MTPQDALIILAAIGIGMFTILGLISLLGGDE